MPSNPSSWYSDGDRVRLIERPDVTGTVEGDGKSGLVTVKHDHGGRAIYRDEQLEYWRSAA